MSSIFDIDVLDAVQTPIGMICLRTRPNPLAPDELVTEITIDHEFLMSSLNTASERALSSAAVRLHPGRKLRVLVGGLGLGYTAWEALQSDRVDHVRVIEFLPAVIGWTQKGMIPLADELNADPRLEVVEADVYALLGDEPRETWDLILIDVDHSPDEWLGDDNATFYSDAGLRTARKHLAPDGYLGVWSHGPHTPFGEGMRRVFGNLTVEDVTFDNPFLEDEDTNWLFFSKNDAPAS